MIEVQPLAVLNLSALYTPVVFLGTFNQIQSFRTPTADFSEAGIRQRGTDENYVTWGHRLRLAALAQFRVGNFAVRDNLQFFYSAFRLRDGDTVFYNLEIDLLEPNFGWSLVNDLDAIYLFDSGFKLGGRYTLTHGFYQQKHFLPGEPLSLPNSPTHRVGPALLYTFYDRPDRRFNRPTVVLLSQWWVRHRWRTGVDVHPAVPYLALAFLFEGELLPDPRRRRKKR
jgi:hypothetical protein